MSFAKLHESLTTPQRPPQPNERGHVESPRPQFARSPLLDVEDEALLTEPIFPREVQLAMKKKDAEEAFKSSGGWQFS